MTREQKIKQMKAVVADCQAAYNRALEFDREEGTRASAENLRETKSELKLAEKWLKYHESTEVADLAAV